MPFADISQAGDNQKPEKPFILHQPQGKCSPIGNKVAIVFQSFIECEHMSVMRVIPIVGNRVNRKNKMRLGFDLY